MNKSDDSRNEQNSVDQLWDKASDAMAYTNNRVPHKTLYGKLPLRFSSKRTRSRKDQISDHLVRKSYATTMKSKISYPLGATRLE